MGTLVLRNLDGDRKKETRREEADGDAGNQRLGALSVYLVLVMCARSRGKQWRCRSSIEMKRRKGGGSDPNAVQVKPKRTRNASTAATVRTSKSIAQSHLPYVKTYEDTG